jgi:hypothetical protein
MKAPLAFVHGNCVFASGLDDAWAAFVVELSSYAWLSHEGKRSRFLAMLGAIEAAEVDLQILRVSHDWGADDYRRDVEANLAARVDAAAAGTYAGGQLDGLRGVGRTVPFVVLLARLADPQRDVGSFLSDVVSRGPSAWRRDLRVAIKGRDRRVLAPEQLGAFSDRADRLQARLADFLRIRKARGAELQWLVRRGFCRGLGEPSVDERHMPRALTFERSGKALLAPLEADVVRWMDSYVECRGRCLRVESELGVSWQAHLVLGALPDRVDFPGPDAELMFAPVESLPFGVDLALTARYLPNDLAVRIARRRIQDADQILQAEAAGELGPTDFGMARTQEARDLLAHLQVSSRPPLLRATVAIAIGASSEEELEARVELCRRAFGEVRIHRPLGDQLQLFIQHLPGQHTRVSGYDDTMTTEQVAAMMPDATHAVGSESGFYLGHTLSGSRQPVRFNLREGSDQNRNTAILSLGALGSGKTTLTQKLEYEGFLQGARVIDCDPKGDHRFHLLEDVAPHVEEIPLRPDPALRGMLDPLRVAPPNLRQDGAVSFLRDLLPHRAEPAWETSLIRAVDRVLASSRQPTCLEVVRALRLGDPIDVQVGEALEVYARSGLTQLGFADGECRLPAVGVSQVTYLPIRDLPAPSPGVPRSEYSQAERIGEQIVRLIAMFAMHLMASERDRLKLFCFDEGWRLLGDPVGRSLLASLQRMGRSELAVPIISTQLVTDALVGERESLEHLVGATFVFGVRSRVEASRALSLLGLDPDDREMQGALLEFEEGRCLFRDHRGRVEAIQIEVLVPALVRAFSTTPEH